MATAIDGKQFSGRQAMLSHNRKLPPMGGGMKKGDPLKMPGMGGGADDSMGGGAEDPAAVVAEHGPANEIHVSHDRAANKHHVHSEHEDGHQTESDHASSDEAHDHGKALAMDPGEGGEQMGGGGDDGAVYE